MGIEGQPNQEQLAMLKNESILKPLAAFVSDGGPVVLELSANSTYLITVTP